MNMVISKDVTCALFIFYFYLSREDFAEHVCSFSSAPCFTPCFTTQYIHSLLVLATEQLYWSIWGFSTWLKGTSAVVVEIGESVYHSLPPPRFPCQLGDSNQGPFSHKPASPTFRLLLPLILSLGKDLRSCS